MLDGDDHDPYSDDNEHDGRSRDQYPPHREAKEPPLRVERHARRVPRIGVVLPTSVADLLASFTAKRGLCARFTDADLTTLARLSVALAGARPVPLAA
jgi:hypothetical protein